MTSIEFLRPGFLWLLAALPLLLLPKPPRDRVHLLLRALLFAALVGALARPCRFGSDASEHHVLLVDRSDSARGADRDAALSALPALTRRLAARGTLRSIDFGAAATDESGDPTSTRPAADATAAIGTSISTSPISTSPIGTSPIGAALLTAAGEIPLGGRGAITLISDGLATDAGFGIAAQTLVERRIAVHAVPLSPPRTEVVPVDLRADAPLRVGRTASVRVDLIGEAPRVSVALRGPQGDLALADDVTCDGAASVLLAFEPDQAGFLPLTVTVTTQGAASPAGDEQRLARTFAVQDPWRVLYLGDRTTQGGAQLARLLGPGFTLEERAAISEEGVGRLAAYDLVILDDQPANELPAAFQGALIDEVTQRGAGLFVCGGNGSFGPGGYHDSPLEPLLPVELVQKEEKRDPSTTLVLIIDTSGSMGGERVQLAKEVARLAISRLLPHDKVGIVEFYGSKRWAAPIQPASNAIDIQRALNRLDAGGGTVILPAIEEAFYGLQNVQTRFKHVLILTDGGVENGAFEPLLRKMADKGINVSTVLVGPEAHSEFLVTLANWGKGRFYSVPNRFNLPEILLKQPASARLPAYRPGAHALIGRGGVGWWGSVDATRMPPIQGYVETRARPGADLLIETVEGNQPVLATWRYGSGAVTAMTTEPVGRGTASWAAWSDYGTFLGRVLHRTAGDARDPYRFTLRRNGSELVLTAERRSAPPDAQPAAWQQDDDGERELAFRELAPGHFAARLICDPAREVRIFAGLAGDAITPRTRLVSSAHEDVAHERQVDPARAIDLDRLARATGGALVAVLQLATFDPAVGPGDAPIALRELWPLLLLTALGLYLADIAWRRRPELRGPRP